MGKNNSEILPVDEILPEPNVEGDGEDGRYAVTAQPGGNQPYKSASFMVPDFPPLAVPTESVPTATVANIEQPLSDNDRVRMAEVLLDQFEGMGTTDAHAAHQVTEHLKTISAH